MRLRELNKREKTTRMKLIECESKMKDINFKISENKKKEKKITNENNKNRYLLINQSQLKVADFDREKKILSKIVHAFRQNEGKQKIKQFSLCLVILLFLKYIPVSFFLSFVFME